MTSSCKIHRKLHFPWKTKSCVKVKHENLFNSQNKVSIARVVALFLKSWCASWTTSRSNTAVSWPTRLICSTAPAPLPLETGRSKVTAFHQHLALSRISGPVDECPQLFHSLYRTYKIIMTCLMASNHWKCTQTNWELGCREKPKLYPGHIMRSTDLLQIWPAWSSCRWTVLMWPM